MYFISKSHEEKFNEIVSNHLLRSHVRSFVYLELHQIFYGTLSLLQLIMAN